MEKKASEVKTIKLEPHNLSLGSSLDSAIVIQFTGLTMRSPTRFDKFLSDQHSMAVFKRYPLQPIRPRFVQRWGATNELVTEKLFKFPKGAYQLWLTYKKTKGTWVREPSELSKMEVHSTYRLIWGHIFFKTDQDFYKWLGEKATANLFAALL